METRIERKTLAIGNMRSDALAFYPAEKRHDTVALFAHGYTASKNDMIPWCFRLAKEGIPTIALDIPGHYQGSFHEVSDIQVFKDHAHEIFTEGFKTMNIECETLICGGHSLGGLLALKSLKSTEFAGHQRIGVGVGLGVHNEQQQHLYETPLFKKAIAERAQLVSKVISPDVIFPWIYEEKRNLKLPEETLYLVTGKNDDVVGPEGQERFQVLLEKSGAQVHSERVKNLPHHQPELAAPHIWSQLKTLIST